MSRVGIGEFWDVVSWCTRGVFFALLIDLTYSLPELCELWDNEIFAQSFFNHSNIILDDFENLLLSQFWLVKLVKSLIDLSNSRIVTLDSIHLEAANEIFPVNIL